MSWAGELGGPGWGPGWEAPGGGPDPLVPGLSVPPPQAAGGRPVLYQVVARHSYSAQGPADLGLRQGDTVDVLCEGRRQHTPPPPAGAGSEGTWLTRFLAVDQAWLEGHCDGRVGIFPKSFVFPAGQR